MVRGRKGTGGGAAPRRDYIFRKAPAFSLEGGPSWRCHGGPTVLSGVCFEEGRSEPLLLVGSLGLLDLGRIGEGSEDKAGVGIRNHWCRC